MTWLLILATYTGGNITMQPVGNYRTLTACTGAGRAQQTTAWTAGKSAAVMCIETKGRK